MFIANLMASVLALAMVGASTASVSKIENNSFDSGIVLNRDVHRLADTGGTITNYTGTAVSFTDFPSVVCEDGESFDFRFYFDSTQDATEVYWYLESQEDTVLLFTCSVSCDWYLNGTLVGPCTIDGSSYKILSSQTITATDYIWVSEHGVTPSDAEPYTPVDMLGDIADGLTGGIAPVAEGIGSGLQSLVQDIFLNADHDGLSVFGIVIICFAGLALALGLSRWVLNFVDTLGARDR